MGRKRLINMMEDRLYRNIADPHLFYRAQSQRGPSSGMGRGPGRPFGGIVERTPVVWIDWIVQACKRVDISPGSLKVFFHGVEFKMTTVRVGFGKRWYWLCPLCLSRREAIYYNGKVGCRVCLHLGYLSQCHRKSSAWPALDYLLSRKWPYYRMYEPRNDIEGLVIELRERLQREIDAIVEAVKIESKG